MGLNFNYFLGKNQLEYGIEVLGFRTNFEFYNSVNRLIQQEESTTELGAYFRYKIISKNKKLVNGEMRLIKNPLKYSFEGKSLLTNVRSVCKDDSIIFSETYNTIIKMRIVLIIFIELISR